MNSLENHINRKFLIRLTLISILVQVLFFSYNIYEEHKYDEGILEGTKFTFLSGDAHSYFEPIESLIQTGVYEANSVDAGTSKYGRTPYYGLFYGFFRLFFDQLNALDAVILFQLILRIISGVVFYRISFALTRNKNVSLLAFLIYISMSSLSIHTYRFLTESLSLSFFIFGWWYFIQWKRSRRSLYLLLSGFFAAYIICMRPFMIPVIGLLVALNIYLPSVKTLFLQKTKQVFIFFIPLVLLLSPWVIRNYAISGKVILFQESVNAGYQYTPADLSLRYFLTATGENFLSWDYDAAGSWFDDRLAKYSRYQIPESILCNSVTEERMILARDYYQHGVANNDLQSLHKADSLFTLMRTGFIEERPFYYYVISPLKILKRAYIHNGVEVLQKREWYEYAYKVIQGGLYYLVTIAFLLAVFLRSCRIKGWLWTVPLVLGIVLCIGFRFSEHRYFICARPILILYAAVLLEKIAVRLRVLKQ